MPDTILYIEATSGIAGDMLLGAFLELGVPPEVFANTWNALDLDNYEVEIFRTEKSGCKATQCRVRTQEEKGPKRWSNYETLLKKSDLPTTIKNETLMLLKKLFQIEASIHGTMLQKLHLHEMGGTDLMLDVTGTLAAIEYMKPSAIFASPINTGKGFVSFSHGTFPIPTPATSILLEGAPVFQNEVEGELTTPTGALLIRHLAREFGVLPELKLAKVGVGAGERDIVGHPNILRLFLGERGVGNQEETYLIESNVDDSSPQIIAYFMEKAFAQGALDVFFTPIFMKKNRPAVRISALAPQDKLDSLAHLFFSETSAIGLRYWKVGRKKLERKWIGVRVDQEQIRIKESYLDGTLYHFQPEFEDCKRLAAKWNRPIKAVIADAIYAYRQSVSKPKKN